MAPKPNSVRKILKTKVPTKVPFIGDELHHSNQLFYALTETWLNEQKDAEIHIEGYQIYRSDCSVKRIGNRGRDRGGVAVYLRDDLTPLTTTLLEYSNGAVLERIDAG